MQAYSEIVAEARACFLRMQEHGIKTTEDILLLWNDAFAIGRKFSEYSPLGGIRFAQADFDSSTWKLASKLFEPLVQAGCVERRQGDRRIGGALVLKPDVTSEVLATAVKPKREYKKKAPVVVVNTVIERGEERILYRTPPRKAVKTSVAIIIDLANLSQYLDGGEDGKRILSPLRMDWGALRSHLSTFNGQNLPLDRAVLCVSRGYYEQYATALEKAVRHGFVVAKMPNDKGADPVVMSEIVKAVLHPLNIGYVEEIPKLVIVSGDSDFVPMIHVLRPLVAHAGQRLHLKVVSWRHSLSSELFREADEVLFVDDILQSIDPIGAKAQIRNSGKLMQVAA